MHDASIMRSMLLASHAAICVYHVTTTKPRLHCFAESGWNNDNSFCQLLTWIDKRLPDDRRPFFLFVDEPTSRFSYDAFLICRRAGIHLIAFPPNLTWLLQPLDVGVHSSKGTSRSARRWPGLALPSRKTEWWTFSQPRHARPTSGRTFLPDFAKQASSRCRWSRCWPRPGWTRRS